MVNEKLFVGDDPEGLFDDEFVDIDDGLAVEEAAEPEETDEKEVVEREPRSVFSITILEPGYTFESERDRITVSLILSVDGHPRTSTLSYAFLYKDIRRIYLVNMGGEERDELENKFSISAAVGRKFRDMLVFKSKAEKYANERIGELRMDRYDTKAAAEIIFNEASAVNSPEGREFRSNLMNTAKYNAAYRIAISPERDIRTPS